MPEQPALRQGLQEGPCPRGALGPAPLLSRTISSHVWLLPWLELCPVHLRITGPGKGQGAKGKGNGVGRARRGEGGVSPGKGEKGNATRTRKCGQRAGDGDRDGQPGEVQAGSGHIASWTFAPVLAKNSAAPGGTAFTQPPGRVRVGLGPTLHRVPPKCLPGLNLPSSGPASPPPSSPGPPHRPPPQSSQPAPQHRAHSATRPRVPTFQSRSCQLGPGLRPRSRWPPP